MFTADMLINAHARGACANWVLGHIAAHRNKVLDFETIEVAQVHIGSGLRGLTFERAIEMTKVSHWEMTRAEAVLFLLRHGTYHTGQLALLAELPKA